MEFKFEGRAKLLTQILMVVGLIALVGGYLTDPDLTWTPQDGGRTF